MTQRYFQIDVLPRFMSENEIETLISKYEKHLQPKRAQKGASEEDVKIFKQYKAGVTIGHLSKIYGKSYTAINGAITRAVLAE